MKKSNVTFWVLRRGLRAAVLGVCGGIIGFLASWGLSHWFGFGCQ